MDEATWAALAAALTILGAIWTIVAFRRRGVANGLRALGLTLLPAAAWLTGTLELFTEIALSTADWATGLVLSPVVWLGTGLAGLSFVLLVVSGFLRDRQLARGQAPGRSAAAVEDTDRARLPEARSTRTRGSGDPELDEIEELLRRRGIS